MASTKPLAVEIFAWPATATYQTVIVLLHIIPGNYSVKRLTISSNYHVIPDDSALPIDAAEWDRGGAEFRSQGSMPLQPRRVDLCVLQLRPNLLCLIWSATSG